MKIALIGYGKMGQEIERAALSQGHEIIAIIDNLEEWEEHTDKLKEAEVAIDFSTPDSVVDNIFRCFEINLPVVTGTTGWNHELENIRSICILQQKSLFYAPNFSIGMNLFFELNRVLASLMARWSAYEIGLEETHHLQKLDTPSGTAIVLANDIIRQIGRKNKWVRDQASNEFELGIKSFRKEDVTGTHSISYESEADVVKITHTAKNRKGFALGALQAAQWLIGKTGFYEMKDMLNS